MDLQTFYKFDRRNNRLTKIQPRYLKIIINKRNPLILNRGASASLIIRIRISR